jgi:hypothetical protein
MCKYKGRDLKKLKASLLAGNEADLKFAEKEFLTEEFYIKTGCDNLVKYIIGRYRYVLLEGKKEYWKALWSHVELYAVIKKAESIFRAPEVEPIMPTVEGVADDELTVISEFTARIRGHCKYLNAFPGSNASRKVPGNVRGKGEWLGTIPLCPCQGNMTKVEMTYDGPAVGVSLKNVDGLVTGNMGACITVVCLFAWTNTPGGPFNFCSMKHMAGGYRKNCNWASIGPEPRQVEKLCSMNNAFALVATSRDNYITSDVVDVLRRLRQQGFLPANIIVDMMMSGGFAVNKNGEFGEPVKSDVERLEGKELARGKIVRLGPLELGRAKLPPRVGQ